MATTNYNKYKDISPTSQNDSGATVDKAQPVQVIGEVTPKEFDGFEDGDYTSSPQWTETAANGTATVQSTTVKNGSSALEITTSGAGAHQLNHDRGTSDSISDGDRYTAWMRQDNTSNYITYGLTNSGFNGADEIRLDFTIDGEFRILTQDSSANVVSNVSFGSYESNTWYRVQLEINPSVSEATVRIYSESNNILFEETVATNGAKNLQNVYFRNNDNSATTAYFDDVSYSTTDASSPYLDDTDTGTGSIILDWTNISSESDIAVYDQNGNLLPYEIESFDATSETAVLWCWNSWVRDDSVQAQIVYGDGPASSEENVTGTWNNTGQNALAVWHLNESSGSTIDSTSNNIDSTTTTGTVYNTTGQFDGARDFDGTDDAIQFGDTNSLEGLSSLTVVAWPEFDVTGSNDHIVGKGDASNTDVWRLFRANNDTLNIFVNTDSSSSTTGFSFSNTDTSVQVAGVYDGSNNIIYSDGTQQASNALSGTIISNTAEFAIGGRGGDDRFLDGTVDETRVYNDAKSNTWIQADYDASPKAGQVFFSQSAAQTTVQTVEETFSQDISVKDEDRTKGFSQTVILENRNIPEQFTQDVAISDKDVTKTLDTDVAILDKDVEETFTQDVTLFDKDVEKSFSQTVSIKAEDQTQTFSQDVFISEGNEAPFSQDVSIKDEDREKSFSQDLIIENANIPEQFNQDVNIADLDNEQSFSQDLLVADLDQEATFSQDVLVADQMTETFSNSVVIAKQPAPDITNPLLVNITQPTSTYAKVLNPTNTSVKIKDIDL